MNKWLSSKNFFSSVQWLFFIFANTVVVPISVASVFKLSPSETQMMLSSSLVFTGIASIFQGLFGHRFPFMEGHSGLLWGVILNLGISASSMGMSLMSIGGGIATGILLASAVTILLISFKKGVILLQKLFSPMVMTVYLFLLTFQLIFIFFEGMFPLTESGTIDVYVSLLSLAMVIFVSLLKLKGNSFFSNFSILIGLIVGWVIYSILFNGKAIDVNPTSDLSLTLFPLGKPNLEFGIIFVSFFAVMMNLSNTIAAISAGDGQFKRETPNKSYRNSIFITTIFTVLGGLFGLVPYTPFSSSIGFLQSTRIFKLRPFLFGGGLLILMGLIPKLASFLATMPITVGNSVLFVAYLQLFGTAYSSLNGTKFDSNSIFRLALPVLIGVSLMKVQPSIFSSLPILIQPFITNGLIMGVIISIFIEKIIKWDKQEPI
jgi:xanthine/uracil permease